MKAGRLGTAISVSLFISLIFVLLGASGCSCSSGYKLIKNSDPGDGGAIDISPLPNPNGKYDAGAIVTIEARPSEGFKFVRWSGDEQGTQLSKVVTMDRDKSITAEFTNIPMDSLITSVNPSGSGVVDPSGGSYQEGARINLTATPSSKYEFDYWSGDAAGKNPTTTVTMDSDKQVTANFARIYILTISVSPSGGSVNPSGGSYKEGSVVTLTASPSAEYEFDCWSGGLTGTDPKATITMDSDKAVIAKFSRINNLNVSITPSGSGTVNLNPSGGSYKEGSVVTLTASPSAEYEFDGWSGDLTGTDPKATITMDSDKEVTANFRSGFEARITTPLPDATVSQWITIKGTANSNVPEGKCLWVVVRYGHDIWPQTIRIVPEFSARTQTYVWFVDAQVGVSGDRGKTFSLGVLLVPEGIDDEFMEWFEVGKATGDWPGFKLSALQAEGANMLDSISVKRG